ncbi:zona pellucida protein C [Rhinichthys klamathensis goyatoka]|uniref:zona pellucida protein C n=1 Tax=Rhinichthys klamathensis goyatoka TaxID=3034132 RepID=UPI0024B60745|nr:zona pellucida protein C [Rhinichthys klamathensis goyatoka]
MAAVFVVFCCAIACLALPVTSNGNDFNGRISAYSPGMVNDVWHVSDFPGIAEDGLFLNGIPQPHTFDGFASGFPMPYDMGLLERRNVFSLRIMNSSWSDPADTNVFHKGEQLHLQVSASPAPGQQLYVQSCHASSSPNPAEKPEIALIINKGCVASKESLVKFVLRRSDVVNLVVRTSSLKSSEIYLHCRVYLSDVGLTSVTKFCNYNKLKSRWVDLGGQTSVCDCCGKRCRSLEHAELPDSLDLNAVVSTGPLMIKDQSSTSLSDNSATKSSPTVRNLSDKRLIMAGASFSGSSMQNIGNVSPWPVQPSFGGLVIISQGQGGDLSMWLPDIMELELPPVVQVGIGYPENHAVDVTLQSDEPFRKLKPDESTAETSPTVAVDEGKAKVEAVDLHDVAEDRLGMWHLKDVARLHKIQGKPVVTEVRHLLQPQLNLESEFDFLSNDKSLVNPTPDKLSESAEDKGEVVFRQAEMVFKSSKGAKLLEPVLFSKLSLKQAADGSSSLNYEEQKRPSMRKRDKTPQLERDGEKRQKDERVEDSSEIKGLVSSLLDELRSLDW